MNDAPIPVELTNFVPEASTPINMPTWRLGTDYDKGTVEINTNVWSKSLIATIVCMFIFIALVVGIGLYCISHFSPGKMDVLFYVFMPFCGFNATLIVSGILVFVTRKNAALWKNHCRFRFDQTMRELYFSREDKRYSVHDYSSVVIGITSGYNLRDLPQYQDPNKESSRQTVTRSRRRDEMPERVTELFFLVQLNDGTWSRHLVAYDQNAKAIRRAAVQLQEMLDCRLASREMSKRECAVTQLPGAADEHGNRELMSRSKNKNKLAYTSLVVFFLAGFGMICYGLYCVHNGKASLSWPTCIGTVTKTEVKRNSGGRNLHPDFVPKITYSYSVSERQYTGDRHAFGTQSFSERGDAQKIVDEYPVNSEVTVYYSPNHPETSVLLPGVRPAAWMICIFGAVFSTIPFLFLLFMRRVPRELDFSAPNDRSEPIITLP